MCVFQRIFCCLREICIDIDFLGSFAALREKFFFYLFLLVDITIVNVYVII